MLHPALKAFHCANAERFPDLKIIPYQEDGGFLKLFWENDDDESFSEEIVAFMLGDDADPSFECDDDSISGSDHFAKAVEAFAWRLLDSDEFADFLKTATDQSESEPGTFGALVWTKAIDLHLDDMSDTIARLRTERARLNPTTIADLPLFARDNTPVDADDCDPHGPGVQCHACAAEE